MGKSVCGVAGSPHPTTILRAQWMPTETPSRANPGGSVCAQGYFQAPLPQHYSGPAHPGFLSIWLHPMILARLPLYSSQGRVKGHRLTNIFNMGGSSNWEQFAIYMR